MQPRAITGIGVVSPLGIGRESFQASLEDVDAARVTAFAGPSEVLAEVAPDARTAEVWGWEPKDWLGKKGHRNFDRLTKFLITAAKLALIDAGVKADGEYIALEPKRVGICSATAYGSLDAITELNRVAELEDPRYINPTRFPNTVINAAAGYVSIWEDLRAPNTTIVDGGCGALDAALLADTHLVHKRADAFLVGGGEVISEPLYTALDKLGVVHGCAEGKLELGEGAAYVVVERADEARERGAKVLGEIVGYGTSFHPPTSEALLVHASAESVVAAVRMALSDAGLEASDVDVVCGATCGLEMMDEAEGAGLREVFGDAIAVVAPKQTIGETFGAAGAFGLVMALGWLHGSPVAPLFSGTAPEAPRTVLVTTVGLYGNVSTIVVRKTPEQELR